MAKQKKQNEFGRRCKRCGFGWFATPVGAVEQKPRWYDENATFTKSNAARMIRRTANYDREQRAIQAWSTCSNCGSTQVGIEKAEGFVLTGRIAPPTGGQSVSPPSASPSPAASFPTPRPANQDGGVVKPSPDLWNPWNPSTTWQQVAALGKGWPKPLIWAWSGGTAIVFAGVVLCYYIAVGVVWVWRSRQTS